MTKKLANREPAAILKQSKSPIFLETRDLMFARVFFAPTRHLESGDGPGDEVGPWLVVHDEPHRFSSFFV